MIKAVIFDMDGLLIDSEPLWEEAEKEIFAKVGISLTSEMKAETTGLRVDEVVAHWYKYRPWKEPSRDEIAGLIDNKVGELVRSTGEPKPGVHHAIAVCEQAGLPLAIASSSSGTLIDIVLKKLRIRDKFKVIHSAQDETHGKPHPNVYISTAQKLGVRPDTCLAFEDSANGVLAAKAAKMKCIAIPEPELRNDKRFGIADKILDSLRDLQPEMLK